MRLFLILLIIYLTGCTQKAEQEGVEKLAPLDTATVITEGQKITEAAFKTLSSNLQQALSESGVSYALEFCNIEAMPLTDSLSRNYEVKIARTSHRPRNPANRADSLEMVSIRQYLDHIKQQKELEPQVYTKATKNIYHAPIRINSSLCLNCHGKVGSDITEENLNTLQDLYPNDKATGFEMGELRGLWVIDFPRSYFNE